MRTKLPPKIEGGRLLEGDYASTIDDGPMGAFRVRAPSGVLLLILSSGAGHPETLGWEHVSVSTAKRCPTWEEMSWVKDQFFEETECVVQFHPARENYVNRHEFTLHLWRHERLTFPMPPIKLV